jgi:hypothetical protein
MRIRWRNIFLVLLLVVLAMAWASPNSPFSGFFERMNHVGPAYPDHERMLGIIAWVLVMALLIVVLRKLFNHPDR